MINGNPRIDLPPVGEWAKSDALNAPEGLAALQEAWDQERQSDPQDRAQAEGSTLTHRRPRFLNLHAIAQISLEAARPAFSLLAPGFPAEWKQQVRQVRGRLNQMQAEVGARSEQSLQVVAVTSLQARRSRHGLAANLAYMLASIQENRVLLIDAKLGHPDLHHALELPTGPGLCEATRARREELPQCLRRIGGTQLYLMTAGQADAYPLDPIDLRGLHVLLHGLRQQFDWVLIDGPAFDTPADAMALSQCADGTLFVVEQERDRFADLSRALAQTQGRYLLGAVMT